ncbi:NAD(P)H-hydrate dehydratase [Belliella sp. R4-6]|uniref:Bifunctional NAD(P)H-hydrate repair enzyme n=1 Tax=Belliella alkalica TaxID=1730871 RepID=A0ABS9VHA8_9BACT|nr:NAD(P)H-hydrate dehydratase [Belliella alkalica]MCH7415833.1 NAD(P)H-hydrate dehydratase [Belliella alkalica]
MLPILVGESIKELDQEFILSKGILSLDLMEQAANAFTNWFYGVFEDKEVQIYIFCGPGNNGGDGLAIARLLSENGYSINVFYLKNEKDCSNDFQANFERLPKNISATNFEKWDKKIEDGGIIIDAIFGVGLSRVLEGPISDLICELNSSLATRIAIDLPSGLPSDSVTTGQVFHSDHTVTFQFPKLSLLFPEHIQFTGDLHIIDIGIEDGFLQDFSKKAFYIRKQDISSRHRFFHRFSHKGDFGRVLFIGGAPGKLGALFLSSYAALRTGSGLVSCAPEFEDSIGIQVPYNEIMLYQVKSNTDLAEMDAIGIGSGWGNTIDPDYFLSIMIRFNKPMVIDADAINLLASNPFLLQKVPKNSILTPHVKEFERLVGKVANHAERIEKAISFAIKYEVILILKGAHTLIALPDGRQLFNSSGNQYMATAGSGDVLTGMITSFLGQGYTPENAAICGVFHHGLAGELASESKRRGMVASDIIEKIPTTFVELKIS